MCVCATDTGNTSGPSKSISGPSKLTSGPSKSISGLAFHPLLLESSPIISRQHKTTTRQPRDNHKTTQDNTRKHKTTTRQPQDNTRQHKTAQDISNDFLSKYQCTTCVFSLPGLETVKSHSKRFVNDVCIVSSRLVSSRLVSSRLVSSRLVSCVPSLFLLSRLFSPCLSCNGRVRCVICLPLPDAACAITCSFFIFSSLLDAACHHVFFFFFHLYLMPAITCSLCVCVCCVTSHGGALGKNMEDYR
jgi:hypothetical protein